MRKVTTKSTSIYSEKVEEPIILNETSTTRRILFATINDKKVDTGETVSFTVVHQRKNAKDEWENVDHTPLSSLRAGEAMKIKFNSEQTKRLFDGLRDLYAVSKEGVKFGEHEYVVGSPDEIVQVPKNRKLYIEKLLDEDHAEEVWSALVSKDPTLATRLSMARIQSERAEALKEFEKSLKEDKPESYWQDFFKNNQWIFGYGLNYHFLNMLSDQPAYGGASYTGKGNQKGDYLLNTQASVKFTVLVEIKRPNTPLISKDKKGNDKKYRNGAYLLSAHLLGGTSQLQVNCKTWNRKSVEPENADKLRPKNINTVNPKGILVIGNTKEFEGDREKAETFELFRSNTNTPDILTFDELFERAKFIVENDYVSKSTDEIDDLLDDLPF